MPVNEERLNEFVEKFVRDLGAVFHAATVLVGDRLGLYAAMGDGEPITPGVLARRTGCDKRYVSEWLAAQAASGYVEYDASTGSFHLTPEQAFVLTSPHNPVFAPGGFQVAASTMADVGLVAAAMRTGAGVDWGEHDEDLFQGTDRFFRPNYIGNLVESWLPALDGVVARMGAGARVADIGCGYGSSTILMAQAYQNSTFLGSDPHAPSVEAAHKAAVEAGVADRCAFEVASASEYAGDNLDLVTSFDCLHDMGDPVGAAQHVRATLAPHGIWMIVEPHAADHLEDNLNPVGRIFYAASTLICIPNSRSQEVGLALGAQAGEARIREVTERAGFTRFRRAAKTPFNLVYEARP